MYGLCFVIQYLLSLLVLQSSRLGTLLLLPFDKCDISIQCILRTVPWVGLQRVTVAFLCHTHLLLFSNFVESLCFQKQTIAGFSW